LTSTPPLLVVITGPSAVGKDSLLAELRELLPDAHFAITATSRGPRAGEKDGVDYYFYSAQEFEQMIEHGELVEHARVYGDWKGVPRRPLVAAMSQGKDVLMRTDVQGARYIGSRFPPAVTIFINPPSMEELERRLSDRGADDEPQSEIRRRKATEEMSEAAEFDYTVVNDDLGRCAREIVEILERERSRPGREAVTLD
jgi:guanylate kinase